MSRCFTLREVRVALLDANVNFKAVKGFIERVRVKAVSQDGLTSCQPCETSPSSRSSSG